MASAVLLVLFLSSHRDRRQGGGGGVVAGNGHVQRTLPTSLHMTCSRVPPGSTLHPMLQRQKVTPQDHMNHKKPREAEFSLGHVILGQSLACLGWKMGKATGWGSHRRAHPVTLRSWALALEPVFSLCLPRASGTTRSGRTWPHQIHPLPTCCSLCLVLGEASSECRLRLYKIQRSNHNNQCLRRELQLLKYCPLPRPQASVVSGDYQPIVKGKTEAPRGEVRTQVCTAGRSFQLGPAAFSTTQAF